MRLPTQRRRRYATNFEAREADLRAFRRLLHSKGLTLGKRPESDIYDLFWLPRCRANHVFDGVLEDVKEYFESMEL